MTSELPMHPRPAHSPAMTGPTLLHPAITAREPDVIPNDFTAGGVALNTLLTELAVEFVE